VKRAEIRKRAGAARMCVATSLRHPEYARELEAKSGKCISRTLNIDGQILADASVEDVANVLEKKGIVV
jgi:hypothetical protein